jgi:2-C-methyl-D-erythritol 2,4-cyclodiphosphate synthase
MTAFTHNTLTPWQLVMGQGYDLHRLVADRPLRLGGLTIADSPQGSLGHSDGDVVLHALMDAIMSATGMPGDIGSVFPPTDPQWAGADSQDLLRRLLAQLPVAVQWQQVDVTIFLEAPKLLAYKAPMAQHLAGLLQHPDLRVSIKAKTMEGLGAIGHQQAVAASVLVWGVKA